MDAQRCMVIHRTHMRACASSGWYVAELCARYPSLHVQSLSSHLLSLHTRLRDQRTDTVSFVRAADALLRPLVEFALTTLPTRTIVSGTRSGTQASAGWRGRAPSCRVGWRIAAD